MPVVSVVTAVFGEPRYLESALRSALGQTLREIEVIVADDSNRSDTRSMIAALGDARVRYVNRPSTLGPAENHRRALLECQSELVALLNQDDSWEPRFLEQLVGELGRCPEAELAFCDHWIVDANGARMTEETEAATRRYGRSDLAPGVHLPFHELLLAQTIPLAMGTVLRNRREIFEQVPASAAGAYDLWLTLLFARTGRGAVYVPERLTSWRIHPGQLTARADPSAPYAAGECWLEAMRTIDDPAVRSAARHRALSAFRSALGAGLRGRSTRHAGRAAAALAKTWLARS